MAAPAISLQDLIHKFKFSQSLLDEEICEEHLREASRIIDDHEIVGLELGLSLQEMSDINADASKQVLRRMVMLMTWKQKYAMKATYRKLIEALLKLSKADQAQKVCELLNQTLGSKRKKSTSPSASPPSCKRSCIQIPTDFLSEDEVKVKVENFSKRFNTMVDEANWALNESKTSPKVVIYFLNMPDPYLKTRDEHMPFLDTLNTAAGILELFTALNKYWDHLNYHLLERLIKAPSLGKCIGTEKCLQLQEAMKKYVDEMDMFRRKTTLGIYCKIFANKKKEVPKGFRRRVTKHEWSEWNTLQDVEDFRQRVAQEHQLHQCLVFFKNILFHSVEIIWWIPIVTPLPMIGFQLGSGCIAIEDMNTEGFQNGKQCIVFHQNAGLAKERPTNPPTSPTFQKKAIELSTIMGALLLRGAKQGSLVLVRALLSHPSFDLMARDEEGNTALHIAASSGHYDVVEELASRYSTSSVGKNKEGHTPLHLACSKGKAKCVKFLATKFPAELQVKNNEGKIPADLASIHKHDGIVFFCKG